MQGSEQHAELCRADRAGLPQLTEQAAGGIMEQEREAALALGRLAQELAAQDAGRDEQQAQLQREQASVERLRAALDALAAQQLTVQVWLPVLALWFAWHYVLPLCLPYVQPKHPFGCVPAGWGVQGCSGECCLGGRHLLGHCAGWLRLQLSAGLLQRAMEAVLGAVHAACAACRQPQLAGSAAAPTLTRPCPTTLHRCLGVLRAGCNAGPYRRCAGKGAGAGS